MASRNEEILKAMLAGEMPDCEPRSRIEKLLLQLCQSGGGSGNGEVATDEIFVINSKSGEIDKSGSEIVEAYESGKQMMYITEYNYVYRILPLTQVLIGDTYSFEFCSLFKDKKFFYAYIEIDFDGIILDKFSVGNELSASNPNAVTINGTSYNGAEKVNISTTHVAMIQNVGDGYMCFDINSNLITNPYEFLASYMLRGGYAFVLDGTYSVCTLLSVDFVNKTATFARNEWDTQYRYIIRSDNTITCEVVERE